jgi:hypothetical protein
MRFGFCRLASLSVTMESWINLSVSSALYYRNMTVSNMLGFGCINRFWLIK